MGPIQLCQQTSTIIASLGQAIAEQTPLVGLFNIDLLLGPSGDLALLEINPRYSASMELIPLADGNPRSLVDWHLKCYQNRSGLVDEIATYVHGLQQNPARTVSCKRILYAEKDLQAIDRWGMEDTRRYRSDGGRSLVLIHRDLPTEGAFVATGDPICTAIASGDGPLSECIRLSKSRFYSNLRTGRSDADYSPRSSAKE